MELTILGAGIAGSCAARACRELGVPYRLIDHSIEPNASAVALATLRAPKGSDLAPRAISHYHRHGIRTVHGGWVSGYRRRNPTPTLDADWHAVDPASAAESPTHEEPGNGPTLDCTASGDGTVTFGCTWFHYDPDALTDRRLRIHHTRPYTHITAVSWPGGARLGSSTGNTLEAARTRARDMLHQAVEMGWTTREGWVLAAGKRLRATGDGYLTATPQGARLGGFHRDGYLLAPALALDAVRLALKAAP